MNSGERIEFGQPAPAGVVVDFVAVHDGNTGPVEEPAVSVDWPNPQPESGMKITDLIAALERIEAEQGNLTVAEEKPLALMAVQHAEVVEIPEGDGLGRTAAARPAPPLTTV